MSNCNPFAELKTFQNGYIYKQSKTFGAFRKRYVVVQNNKLRSYKSDEIFTQNPQQYTEVFDLNIYSKVNITTNKYWIKQFEFEILCETGKFRRFRCDSECELKSWVNNIKNVHYRIQKDQLLLYFAGIKPPKTCTKCNLTNLVDMNSIISIKTTLTPNDTVSALKDVIRNTYGIPCNKDILIIYSHTIISKDNDVTLQEVNVTMNSCLLLAISADKPSNKSTTSYIEPHSAESGLTDTVSRRYTLSGSNSSIPRNNAYLNLGRLRRSSSNLSALSATRRLSESNYSVSSKYSVDNYYGVESKRGFDIITQEANVLVHRMQCGHWMNRDSLYQYAIRVFGNNCNANICLKCPHSMDDEKAFDRYWSCAACTYYNPLNISNCEMCTTQKPERSKLCDAKWDYVYVKRILTNDVDETDVTLAHKLVKLELFGAKNAIENECNVQKCSECDTLHYRDRDKQLKSVTNRQHLEQMHKTKCVMCVKTSFCWLCGDKWSNGHFCDSTLRLELVEILSRARLKSIGDSIEVPSIRCCPECCQLIKHSEACKHMKCSACKTDFCFVCLRPKHNGHWQCGGHSDVCAVAQRQNAVTLPLNKRVFKLF